jgi:D-amino-acid dehydrogenase
VTALRTDVAVIGGGIVGLACARELALRGRTVTVLERDRVGEACSFGNAGWLTPSQSFALAQPGLVAKATRWLFDPDSPFYVPLRADPFLAGWLLRFLWATRRTTFERGSGVLLEMCVWSTDAWEELARSGPGEFGFARAGLVAVYQTEKGAAAARHLADFAAAHGVPHEWWSATEVRLREPAVRGRQIGALFYPRDAHCEPYGAVTALADAARRAGATLREGVTVRGAERQDSTIGALDTTIGRVDADEVVLAAGAWSRSLGHALGLRVPILGAKGYSMVVPRLDPHPRHSIYVAERKVALNPHRDGLRIAGTLELVGEDLTVNTRRVRAIEAGARTLIDLPADLGGVQVWRGLRPCAPDGMPLIGRSRASSNLWLATGHHMAGLKTAPATGRLLAELMCGERPTFDPEPCRASRYC